MLSTVYAQKILCNDLSIKFAADVLNGHVDIWDETCTAINGCVATKLSTRHGTLWAVPIQRISRHLTMTPLLILQRWRNAIAEARISAIAMIIEDQLYGLILNMISSGKLRVVPACHVEGPEDPHGVGWVEGGIPGIIECDCYIMEGDEK